MPVPPIEERNINCFVLASRNLFLIAIIGSFAANLPANETAGKQQLKTTIAGLIERLGSDRYSARKDAQDRLVEIGVPALDQLQEAILHPDPQIANSARYLIRSSFTNWTTESDPVEVQNLLKQYGTSDLRGRDDRILRLQALTNDRGLIALLRIAQFEVSGPLSRKAALAILQPRLSEQTDGALYSEAAWRQILVQASEGKSVACRWLRNVAAVQCGESKFDAQLWMEALESESRELESRSGETNRDTWVDFVRLAAEQFYLNGLPAEAEDIAARLLKVEYLERERVPKALDFCLWALNQKLYSLVIRQCEAEWLVSSGSVVSRFRWADIQPYLDYIRAEAHRKLNESDKAEKFSAKAFNRIFDNGVGNVERADKALKDRGNVDVSASDRSDKAEFLYRRRQYDWAEREFREALDQKNILDFERIEIIVDFSRFLADGLDYEKASEIMSPMVEKFKADPTFAKEIDEDYRFAQRDPIEGEKATTFTEIFRSDFLYRRALAAIRKGDLPSAKPDLREAYQLSPANIDIAITMWKNRDDAAWNKEADNAVQDSIDRHAAQLPKLEQSARSKSPTDSATARLQYANTLNTYAWLLVCTDRELENALLLSRQACQLQPITAAYLDTLARCCFKTGRVDEAIRIQKRAMSIEPHTREIARALEEFTSK
jgi:tetratricopeptide (TPR) repeat protein